MQKVVPRTHQLKEPAVAACLIELDVMVAQAFLRMPEELMSGKEHLRESEDVVWISTVVGSEADCWRMNLR